jgi:hypothetical protein
MSGISAICVGGPMAGKVKRILYGRSFVVQELKPILHHGFPITREPLSRDVTYVLQAFSCRRDVWEFWVPEGQSERETLELLLTTYEKAQRLQP